jgi:hypothetical protein
VTLIVYYLIFMIAGDFAAYFLGLLDGASAVTIIEAIRRLR